MAAALLLGTPTAFAAPPDPAQGPAPTSTSAPTGCLVVATGRSGRAWLPWVRVALPGARLVSVDVTTGAASADLPGATVVVQRTARRSPAAAGPVQVDVVVVDTQGRGGVRTCTVDLSRPVVDPDHHVRRVS